MTNEEMLQFRNVLPLFRWVIVTGDGADRKECVYVAPRAEDALVMYRACNPFDIMFHPTGCGIVDMRCERLISRK